MFTCILPDSYADVAEFSHARAVTPSTFAYIRSFPVSRMRDVATVRNVVAKKPSLYPYFL